MSTLRISDAPLLPDVDGTEKIPTGGRGDYAISVDQIKDHIFQDVGKELVGLGNVDNTSDLDKPVSTAQQAALDLKADKTYVDTNLNLKADKTSVYTRSETSLALSKKADLVNGVVPENQIPSSFNDVLEFTTPNLPIVGESGKIYVTTDTNRTWRWSGNQYVEISNGGVSDSALKLQTPRKVANVDFDGTQNIDIPHNNLTNRNVASAHDALSISDGTQNQKEINLYGGKKYDMPVGGYPLNSRVLLNNGSFAKSTVTNNTVDPNTNMTGWVKENSASQILDESGKTQQEVNDLLLQGNYFNLLNYFTPKQLKDWFEDQKNYDVSDIVIAAQNNITDGEVRFPPGTFRITKQIPSVKSWVGVRGGYSNRGTKVIVDSAITLNPVIPNLGSGVGVELKDIRFEDKQVRKHTLYKASTYQVKHSGLRVEKFAVGVDEWGTYCHFEDCYIVNNGIGIKERAIAETGTDVQSTVWGFNRCFFLYNDIGIDASRNYNNGANEDFMNILLTTCGFEKNRIGYNAPTRNWYLTFQNSWFEDNAEYGLYAPNSDVIEINVRHNANSPKSVGTQHSELLPWKFKNQLIEVDKLKTISGTAVEVQSDLKFQPKYLEVSNVRENGGAFYQEFTCPSGAAKASLVPFRDVGTGAVNNCGAGLLLRTQNSASSTDAIRWRFVGAGHFVPEGNNLYQIGDATNKLSSVYTTKVMYTSSVGDYFGVGTPEGIITAGVGSTYRRTDGGAGTCFYVKESGTGNTGWVAK